jgi:DNA ligase-4
VFRENCSPVEHFWLVRIILCDLKIGVKEPQVWDAFHEQAAEYWGRCTNIRKLCHDLHLASRRPLEHVQAGEACGVMLAAMADDVSKVGAMGATVVAGRESLINEKACQHCLSCNSQHIRGFRGEEFIMEVKYDGERIHLHKVSLYLLCLEDESGMDVPATEQTLPPVHLILTCTNRTATT